MPEDIHGRALDAAVAEQFFGFMVQTPTNRKREPDPVYDVNAGAERPAWVRVPYYSSSLSAGLTLAVELERRGWRRRPDPWDRLTERGKAARIVYEHVDGRQVEAQGPYAEALCRVALKAVRPPTSAHEPE